MRKRIVAAGLVENRSKSLESWLDLEHIATIEVTSEDPDFPIESAISATDGPGWRALRKGEQQIRIIFDQPTPIKRIHLRFVEAEMERTQEFTIRWRGADDRFLELVRQQWNFSPRGSTSEAENYEVALSDVSVLELAIRPDVGREDALATLAEWRSPEPSRGRRSRPTSGSVTVSR